LYGVENLTYKVVLEMDWIKKNIKKLELVEKKEPKERTQKKRPKQRFRN
jgi:hypothetical protein